jgi:VanZ family protein
MKSYKNGMVVSIKPKTIENIIVILFEISFILLVVQAVNIEDINRMWIAIASFFITLIPYVAERLLRISFPFGIKIMIPFALFMHTAGGIMRWYFDLSWMYYDKIAHMISGFALGLVIFAIILTFILFSKREMQKRSVLVWTAAISFLFGAFWEYEEMSIDSVMMTTYSGGVYDSIGDTIGNIIGIILCMYVAKRWLDSVPAHKSLSYLIRNDRSSVHTKISPRRRKYKQDL